MPTKVPLTLISSYKLSKGEIDVVIKNLGIDKKTDLEVLNEVDEGVIAGLIIKYDGYYLDRSLKSKLNEIVQSLS